MKKSKNRKYIILMVLIEIAAILMSIKIIQLDLHMDKITGTSLAGVGLVVVVTMCFVDVIKKTRRIYE